MARKRSWSQYAGAAINTYKRYKHTADRIFGKHAMENSMIKWLERFVARRDAKSQAQKARSPPPTGVVKKNKSTGAPMLQSRKLQGAPHSKSAGKIRRLPRKRYTLFDKVGRYGITVCRENGGTSTNATNVCSYIGHCTVERFTAMTDIARALTKWISTIAKKDIVNFNTVAWETGETAPQMAFFIKRRAGLAVEGINIPLTLGTTTWAQIADLIRTNVLIGSTGQLTTNEYMITGFMYILGGQTRRYNFLGARIQVYVKSALKIQNRTLSASGLIDQDDVDNVPLYGKSYEGTGNYMQVASDQAGSSSLDAFTFAPPGNSDAAPVIEDTFAANQPGSEPMKVSQLYHVKRSGKVHLDPGQVKTSILTYYKKFSLNTLLQVLSRGNIVTSSDSAIKIGNYRIFALEKMINSVTTTDVTAVRVAFEHDYKVAMSVFVPPVIVTNTIVSSTPL